MVRKTAAKSHHRGSSAPPATDDASLDERVRRSRGVVLRTASALLIEKGVAGLSVDEVSRRSGVAKTTIYRHWSSRSELVIDACALLSTAQEDTDLGTVERDLTHLLLDLAHLLETADWPRVLPSVVDAAEREPDLAAVYSRIQLEHTAPYRDVLERAKQREEISKRRDTATMVAELVGPLFYRRWFSREPLTKQFIRRVVRTVLCPG